MQRVTSLTAIAGRDGYATIMLKHQPNRIAATLLAALLAALTFPALADSGTITVTRVSGSVKVLVRETPIAVAAGTRLTPPVRIETGSDGFVRIEQASSNLDIGPGSVVLMPVANADSESIIQNLGRVLYSVKPRKSRSFSVQTPYLVSVVKGTVFSVAIENDATRVSLMEGSVELVADGVAPVLLQPNDTARRGMNDRSIEVTKLTVAPPAALPQAAVLGSSPSATNSMSAPQPVVPADAALTADLNEITAAHREQRPSPVVPDNPAPPSPESPQPGAPPATPAPELPAPELPAPDEPTPPAPGVPDTQPEAPVPNDDDQDSGGDDDRDDDVDTCTRRKCDSPDDRDLGGGNDRR